GDDGDGGRPVAVAVAVAERRRRTATAELGELVSSSSSSSSPLSSPDSLASEASPGTSVRDGDAVISATGRSRGRAAQHPGHRRVGLQTGSGDIGVDDDASSDESPPASRGHEEQRGGSEEEEEDEEEDWEDVAPVTPTALEAPSYDDLKDVEVTLDSTRTFTDPLAGKKGPTKSEREARTATHCLHVQYLLWHNAVRNIWLNDHEVQRVLRDQLPEAVRGQVRAWKTASGLASPPQPPKSEKKKSRGRRAKSKATATPSSSRPSTPDLSQGDPTIHLLRVLAAYWRARFKITAPGLRKRGYRPLPILDQELRTFRSGKAEDYAQFPRGEVVKDFAAFRDIAKRCEGSRDVGAQLFTALLRSIGLESRLVSSLQPLGFGWTQAETYVADPGLNDAATSDQGAQSSNTTSDSDASVIDLTNSSAGQSRRARKRAGSIDTDLPFPIYWTEAISPVTHNVIPVDCLVLKTLPHHVATTPELVACFEPRGAKATAAKQVIAYIVAWSADRTAKDVTTRYLKRHTWPGKTKGVRLPVEKVPINLPGRPTRYVSVDWFSVLMTRWARPVKDLTITDKQEAEGDLRPNQPERKVAKAGDTLQSLRSSPEFILERFLRREEALRPGAKPVRTYLAGKGESAKEEKVYKRSDVVHCMSAETWRREGRQPKLGEVPLKRVPIRAVTLNRKREVEEYQREVGEPLLQGLYAEYQTEWIIPPPIENGVIPKNGYGNIDCFVPSMVPVGATHLPYRGTVRVCKRLGIDYAEAVTGFEFGKKIAVPVITGVVVA
ncbi:hypothetical protein KEM52_006609, partial [Ascosphaera acerosa]